MFEKNHSNRWVLAQIKLEHHKPTLFAELLYEGVCNKNINSKKVAYDKTQRLEKLERRAGW